ncbi:MAG: sigma-70 family RNA polymerase sigma factor [Clostridia bacterium]|nr:sigma-70 family RNA polymerase sigma factor [Clostridia bacterium]
MRDVSLIERVALRDHEAMDEIRRRYIGDVARIAATLLGPYSQNQVSAVCEAVWKSLWEGAHRLDTDRADTTGHVRSVARGIALASLRVGEDLPDRPAGWIDEPRLRIVALELAEIPAGTAGSLGTALRRLSSVDRQILVRRYALLEDQDVLAASAGLTREAVAERLRQARARLSAAWLPEPGTPRPGTLSDWDHLEPDLFSDTLPETRLSLDPPAPVASRGVPVDDRGSDLPTESRGLRRAAWILLAAALAAGAFLFGNRLPALLNGTRTTIPGGPAATEPVPTGPRTTIPGATTVVGFPPSGPVSLVDFLDFDWKDISSVAVVRTNERYVRDSRTLRETEDLSHLRSLLTSTDYVFTSDEVQVSPDSRQYELEINADGYYTINFFADTDGRLNASGSFVTSQAGPTANGVFQSDELTFEEFAQEMDTLTALFG